MDRADNKLALVKLKVSNKALNTLSNEEIAHDFFSLY